MPQDSKQIITLEDFRKLTEHLEATVPIYVEVEIDNEAPARGLRVDIAMDGEKKELRVVVG